MDRPGVYIKGLFTETENYTKKETGEVSTRVTVATGRYSYSVYLNSNADVMLLQDLQLGQFITLRARPYAGKNGLSWSDGEIVDVG